MGTWGHEIFDDDLAVDVYDCYVALFDQGKESKAITSELCAKFAWALEDLDDGPVFWLALAQTQWQCGNLDEDVLLRVQHIIAVGSGLERWRAAGEKELQLRSKALNVFLRKIQTPVKRPRKMPKARSAKKAVFQPGDCLAISIPDGTWSAAIVTSKNDVTGVNGVALLAYSDLKKPDLSVFESSDCSWVTSACAKQWSRFKDRFHLLTNNAEVISRVPKTPDWELQQCLSDWGQVWTQQSAKALNQRRSEELQDLGLM